MLTNAIRTLDREQASDVDIKIKTLQEMLTPWLCETDKLKSLLDDIKRRLFLEARIDPNVLQRAANMLSAIYYQQGLTPNKKQEMIEQYLESVRPLIHQSSDTQEQS